MQRGIRLSPGTRFVCDIKDENLHTAFYHIYHVVDAAPNSLLLLCTTLFDDDIYVRGNYVMDDLLRLSTTNALPILREATYPRRYQLEQDENGHEFFVTGTEHVCLHGPNAVTYIRIPASRFESGLKRKARDT